MIRGSKDVRAVWDDLDPTALSLVVARLLLLVPLLLVGVMPLLILEELMVSPYCLS